MRSSWNRAAAAVQRMLGHLATRYLGPCPLAKVARAGGLCRSAAAVAVKRATGGSIHVHLVRLRLAHARGLLAEGAPAAEAAFAAGFGSMGRFYAAWAAAHD
jgi:AraC-like DNA-binding protein